METTFSIYFCIHLYHHCDFHFISISIKLLPSYQWCWSHCRLWDTVRGVAGMFRVARLEECSNAICQNSDIRKNNFWCEKHRVLLFPTMCWTMKVSVFYIFINYISCCFIQFYSTYWFKDKDECSYHPPDGVYVGGQDDDDRPDE